MATSLKYHIIAVSTDAITPLSGGSFRDTGFATPMTLAEDMINTASFKYSKDSNYTMPMFQQALSHYTEECIVKNVLYVDQKQVFGIMDPKLQSLDALQPSNFSSMNLSTTSITDLNGSDTTCGTFWNNEILAKKTTVKNALTQQLSDKNPKFDISSMATAIASVSGLESDAAVASTSIQNAMMNIATTSTLMSTLQKAGTGLSGIDLSNSITAQQSLFQNMTDSTGQFKWMIKVVPVLEFLIFGILLFLAIPMGIVAGFSGAQKGGQMLMNYAFGLVAFSFIDVGLAIVQSISLYYYNNKMADAMIMLGSNPFTASNIPLYMQNMGYMSGMMGLASIIVVPLVVTVVFKGETAAAMGAYNSVMGKYKGDQGGANLSNSLKESSSAHHAEAMEYEEAARRELAGGYGITEIPHGALASQMLEQISSEAASYAGNMGANRVADSQYDSTNDYIQSRAKAGMGSGMQKVTAEIGSGEGLLAAIDKNPDALEDFGRQTNTEAQMSFMSTATKGALSRTEDELSRDNQILAATGSAEMDLRKTTANGLGAVEAFKDGAGSDFSYQTQTDAEKSIAATASKGKASQEIDDLSRENQIDSAKASANKSLVDEVGAGKGLMDTEAFDANGNLLNNNSTNAMIKGAELSSLQKANMQIGTGETGDVDAYAEVALEDGQIAGKTVNATNKRRNELDGSNGTEAWDEDKIADGQAISSTQQQIKTQGVSNALNKEGQDNDDAFRQAAMGSEFSGRKEENDQLGIGDKWTKLTNSDKNHNGTKDDIDLMNMEQDNTAVSAIGGIKSAHAEIEKHKQAGLDTVDSAIKDMVTGGEEKGTSSAVHSAQMRKEFGSHLNGVSATTGETIKNEISKAKKDKEDAANALADLGANTTLSADEKSKKAKELVAKEKDAQERIENATKLSEAFGDGMTLKDVDANIEQSKIQSMVGQAAGIKKNIDKNPAMYAQNAMYSEESKQQSTDAKIKAQDGVDNAVRTDVADASIKAAMQQQALSGSMSEYLQSKEGGSHSKEESEKMAQAILTGGSQAAEAMKNVLASAGSLAFAQSAGKTGADIRGVETAGSPDKFIDLQKSQSAIKTGQSIAQVDEAKRTNKDGSSILDADGKMTKKGQEAYSIGAGEQAETLMRKEHVLSDTDAGKNLANDIRKVDRIKAGYDGKTDTEKKAIDDKITQKLISDGLLKEDGTAKTGVELARGLAGMGSMNFSSSKSLSHNGMTLSANIDGEGNANVTKADGGKAVNLE